MSYEPAATRSMIFEVGEGEREGGRERRRQAEEVVHEV